MLMSLPVWLSYDLPPVVWALLGVALCAAVIFVTIMTARISIILSRSQADDKTLGDDSVSGTYPAVSVIIYARSMAHTLPGLTEQILKQDYPAPFEIIIVNDGIDPTVSDTIRRLMLNHPNLYLTFIPEHSRSLSRRKLSLTLGIKAAQYDTLVFTHGNCVINSPLWLKAMTRHFSKGYKIVIGHAVTSLAEDGHETFTRARAFDETWQALTYLPHAIKGDPYRANGCNLAYSRRLFFNHKGFSETLNLKGGDDDMFIHQISRGTDCTVELSEESIVIVPEDNPSEAHLSLMRARLFADAVLPSRPSLVMGLCSFMLWVWILACAAAVAIGLPSYMPLIISVVSIIAPVIFTLKWRKAMMLLSGVKAGISIPFLALWHPIYHLSHKISANRHRKYNYTWN